MRKREKIMPLLKLEKLITESLQEATCVKDTRWQRAECTIQGDRQIMGLHVTVCIPEAQVPKGQTRLIRYLVADVVETLIAPVKRVSRARTWNIYEKSPNTKRWGFDVEIKG